MRIGATQNIPRSASLLKVIDNRMFLAVTLALCLLMRIAWIITVDAAIVNDSGWYINKGLDIAAGRGYQHSAGAFPLWHSPAITAVTLPTAFWPVGYPAFLGLVFAVTNSVTPTLTAQFADALLATGTVLLTYFLARRLFHSERVARLSALFLALYPAHLAFTALIMPELLFVFLLLAAILSMVPAEDSRHRLRFIVSGVCWGLATLTKPYALVIPAVLLLLHYRKQPGVLIRKGLLLYLIIGIILLPWTIRNYLVFGKFVFVSTNGGVNLLIGNNPEANGTYVWSPQLFDQLAAIPDELERDQVARQKAIGYIASNPAHIISLLPRKVFYLYAGEWEAMGWHELASQRIQSEQFWIAMRLLSQAVYTAMVALSLVTLWHHRHNLTPLVLQGPVIVLIFTLIYLPFFGGQRFHFPVVPWLAIYAAAAIPLLIHRPTGEHRSVL